MANHVPIATLTDLEIYFCDPHSPWQRARNENTNGLLRQYFPKSTDLSSYHRYYLTFVAAHEQPAPQTPRLAYCRRGTRPLLSGSQIHRCCVNRLNPPRPQMPLSGDQIPGPHRPRQATMGDALEAGAQRLLDHLRRPLPGRRDLRKSCDGVVGIPRTGGAVTRWRVVRDLPWLIVFAVLRGGCGWRGLGCGGC